jgi:hypothetical protein
MSAALKRAPPSQFLAVRRFASWTDVAMPARNLHALAKPRPSWPDRRGAGVAEQAGLENRNTRKGIEGSNPSLSASFGFVLVRCCPAQYR